MRTQHVFARFFCAANHTPAKVFGLLAGLAAILPTQSGNAADALARAGGCDYRGQSGICIRVDSNAPAIDPIALEAAYLQAKRDVETRYKLDLRGAPGP